jgi:hypothetical protein
MDLEDISPDNCQIVAPASVKLFMDLLAERK